MQPWRISQITQVTSEGGYDKIFRQTFETFPDEKLKKSYACYLSTSAGPVMGVLYLSTAKLAFCSDNPQSYKVGDQTQCTYYKRNCCVSQVLHKIRKEAAVSVIPYHCCKNRVSVDKSRDRIPIIPPCGAAIR
ncbi:hypothetical protein OPV22_023149 [Ensete ventricosum]|uniref:GRAM domain-containing protein n=1 Tax=Ensete ventricosum TaxID=4639 RepID=A0AAV8QUP3_ENSVE|nr:hypothetical protein OPV22_023149 [Ensete ventricosum]